MRPASSGRAAPLPNGWRRVLLVGFMASGKSTVGHALAERLGWSFLDLDRVVEHWAGAPVASIFERWGERRFRVLEEAVAREVLPLERVVLAPGGGWAAFPGRLEAVPPATLTVWLRVSVEQAVHRLRGAGEPRPLLAVHDPAARARELLESRLPFYREAALHLDTDGVSPDRLAEAILERMRTVAPGR